MAAGSQPHTKRSIKHSATPLPAMSKTARGKRPRPSDASDVEKPPAAIRKKSSLVVANSGLSAASAMAAGGVASAAYTKGMYLAFIDDAFIQRPKGDSTRYNELISQFRSLLPTRSPTTVSKPSATASTSASTPPAPTTAQLRVWLDALTHVVSKLDKSHASLVETIIDVPWATMEDGFVAAYVRFIGALVSARTEWLRPVLEKCVKGFKYRSNYTTTSPSAMPSLTRRTLYGRLHTLLRLLIALIPTLSPSLSPLLSLHFPSKREARIAQICYIDNLLVLSEYCPALVEDILALVIERALNIDVEIQGEPEEWEEVEEELLATQEPVVESIKDVVDRPTAEDENDDSSADEDDGEDDGGLDLDNLDSDDEPDPISDDEAARQTKAKGMSDIAIRRVLENRGKLDAILKVVLDHLAGAFGITQPPPHDGDLAHPSEESTPIPEEPPSLQILERRTTLFCTVLDIFDRTLLRTFKTRNTQFVLFYLCSLNVASSDQFIGVLLGRALFERDAPAVTRIAAAGYAASFVSRASFVDAIMTRKVVKHLCQFLENQMEDYASGNGGSQNLPVFYAVAQAVFYVFCFRWKDLLDEADDDEIVLEAGRRWMMGLETIKKVVSSSFNPLKVCAQPVVNQFASIAHKTNFLYCYAILDANRRVGSREAYPAPSQMPRSNAASLNTSHPTPRQLLVAEEMDSFFPFDPFKLPLSSVYIDGIYRNWVSEDGSASEASTDSDDDDEDESSEVNTETEGEDYGARGGLAVLGSKGDDDDENLLGRSFEAMSLSPDRSAFGGRIGSVPMPSLLI